MLENGEAQRPLERALRAGQLEARTAADQIGRVAGDDAIDRQPGARPDARCVRDPVRPARPELAHIHPEAAGPVAADPFAGRPFAAGTEAAGAGFAAAPSGTRPAEFHRRAIPGSAAPTWATTCS